MNDSYLYLIVALLPLTALMLTLQVNPYHALVIRGILGAIAALVYGVLGAADVALTEALVGTMLAVLLNVVAVRSSLVMRVGVLKETLMSAKEQPESNPFCQLKSTLSAVANRYHLRLELVPFSDPESLRQALIEKEIHATCLERSQAINLDCQAPEVQSEPYQLITRIRRFYEILQSERLGTSSLTYVQLAN